MFDRPDDLLGLVRGSFRAEPVLLLGDLMLDRYIWGDVHRVSPEAPVPVVRLTGESDAPGGAANVAMNLAGLGLRVTVLGAVGMDAAGDRLRELLKSVGVDARSILQRACAVTMTKTRIIGRHQQILRLDAEDRGGIGPGEIEAVRAAIRERLAEHCAAALVSDYAKGVVTPDACREVISAAKQRGIPVVVDPKGRDWSKYEGATVVTPNLGELGDVTGVAVQRVDELLLAGRALMDRLDIESLVVTRGEDGLTLVTRGGTQDFPAAAREVFDVAGAGDTVVAILTAALAAGAPIEDALRLANLGAGIVVGKVGTAPITKEELLAELNRGLRLEQANKLCGLDAAVERIQGWRDRRESVVFTNGCFDLLHAGHVKLLEQARRFGDRLVVGLNTDASVRALKGPERPVVGEQDRGRVLAALASVDLVVMFAEDTPLNLIQVLRPDVLVKGQDYREDEVVGASEVTSWGGRVVLVPLLEGRSTTAMMARARAPRP
jgi:D-beta-D-heptose 7-phosphate kinase/D-beta-D-heptose 1-phosphate adenosyltransferase